MGEPLQMQPWHDGGRRQTRTRQQFGLVLKSFWSSDQAVHGCVAIQGKGWTRIGRGLADPNTVFLHIQCPCTLNPILDPTRLVGNKPKHIWGRQPEPTFRGCFRSWHAEKSTGGCSRSFGKNCRTQMEQDPVGEGERWWVRLDVNVSLIEGVCVSRFQRYDERLANDKT
jgi:hypothetical protein